MNDLSDLGRQQREELIDAVYDTLSSGFDTGAAITKYAQAVVAMLEKKGFVRFQSKNCPACGRDRMEAEHGVCDRGGCPCGGDL